MSLEINLNVSNKNELDMEKVYDILIIGGGPAGLNAALYSKRKGLDVGIISYDLGGQVMDTSSVENYLGFPSISGEGLMKKFIDHVNILNVPYLEYVHVKDIKKSDLIEIHLEDGNTFKSKSVIIATGSKPRKIGIPGELEYSNKGVCYCAICDGPLFADEEVVVAGGGNSAVEAAIDLSKIAKKVTLVHRSNFRADKILVDQLLTLDNVQIKLETQILEVIGDKFMKGLIVKDKLENKEYTIEAAGLFVEIGYLPNSDHFKNILALNSKGEIIVDKYGRTNIDGIFAAGDVTDTPYKQIIMSAGDGAKCALSANEYINTLK